MQNVAGEDAKRRTRRFASPQAEIHIVAREDCHHRTRYYIIRNGESEIVELQMNCFPLAFP